MDKIQFIGKIHSSLKRIEDCPLQESEQAPQAVIEIFKEFEKAIADIHPGDELVLLTWLHKADRTVLSTRPRNNPRAPMTGVFSTRSPDRPNPIGMHTVKVISIENSQLTVSQLEALDQTPLLDIKPVL